MKKPMWVYVFCIVAVFFSLSNIIDAVEYLGMPQTTAEIDQMMHQLSTQTDDEQARQGFAQAQTIMKEMLEEDIGHNTSDTFTVRTDMLYLLAAIIILISSRMIWKLRKQGIQLALGGLAIYIITRIYEIIVGTIYYGSSVAVILLPGLAISIALLGLVCLGDRKAFTLT